MPHYQIEFEYIDTIEASTREEAIRKAIIKANLAIDPAYVLANGRAGEVTVCPESGEVVPQEQVA
jgi:hypothetical protein